MSWSLAVVSCLYYCSRELLPSSSVEVLEYIVSTWAVPIQNGGRLCVVVMLYCCCFCSSSLALLSPVLVASLLLVGTVLIFLWVSRRLRWEYSWQEPRYPFLSFWIWCLRCAGHVMKSRRNSVRIDDFSFASSIIECHFACRMYQLLPDDT